MLAALRFRLEGLRINRLEFHICVVGFWPSLCYYTLCRDGLHTLKNDVKCMYKVNCLTTGFRDSGPLQSGATAPQGEDSIGLFSRKRFGDALESRDFGVEVRRYVCAFAGELARVSARGFS